MRSNTNTIRCRESCGTFIIKLQITVGQSRLLPFKRSRMWDGLFRTFTHFMHLMLIVAC